MPMFQLLLFDASVIIFAHKLGVWSQLTEKCIITITKTVKEQEVYYWVDENETPHSIDLDDYIEKGKIECIEVPRQQLDAFLQKFGLSYLDQMDPGETDSLAFLYSQEKGLICASDKIVFKSLGSLGLGEQGISLEEVLDKVGLSRQVESQLTKKFRLKYTLQGEQEGITGAALKQALTGK